MRPLRERESVATLSLRHSAHVVAEELAAGRPEGDFPVRLEDIE
jgi:hypothetical protein